MCGNGESFIDSPSIASPKGSMRSEVYHKAADVVRRALRAAHPAVNRLGRREIISNVASTSWYASAAPRPRGLFASVEATFGINRHHLKFRADSEREMKISALASHATRALAASKNHYKWPKRLGDEALLLRR